MIILIITGGEESIENQSGPLWKYNLSLSSYFDTCFFK